MLVSDSSAVEEVKDLHHDKSVENEREMSRMDFVFSEISDVIVCPRKSIKHATGHCALRLAHVIFGIQIASNDCVKLIGVLWDYVLAEES